MRAGVDGLKRLNYTPEDKLTLKDIVSCVFVVILIWLSIVVWTV